MKVFKMDDYDWVCANSEEEAKEYYCQGTGLDMSEIDDNFIGEVSLDDTMLVDVKDLQEEDLRKPQNLRRWKKVMCVEMTFRRVIEMRKITKPCFICSTEM